MGLVGTLICKIEIKSDGDVFHELIRVNPHQISEAAPKHIQSCDLHEGEFGKVGCIVRFAYFHDGKDRVAKDVIEAIDEENKSVTYKVIEGYLKELYKDIKFIVHVDTNGENNLVTWTIHYEKLNPTSPHPTSLLEFMLHLTEDIEKHHLKAN